MADTLRQPKTISAQTFLKQKSNVVKYGLLRKKKAGIHFGSWPVRFIVISGGYIYCYKDEQAEAPKSIFSLVEYNHVEEDVNRDNQWRVIAPTRQQPDHHKVLTFACLSDIDRKDWVDAVYNEIRSIKNKRASKRDISDEHYYEDIDEDAESSPGLLGLNALLKSKPIKAITNVVTGINKRYHELKLGDTGNKENSTKLDNLEVHISDEQSLPQAPEIPPARTVPTIVTGSLPEQPPGPVPPRIVKQSLEKEPPPLPPTGLLRPNEEPLLQTSALSPSCPRRNAPPPPKPSRSRNIPTVPEKQEAQPSTNQTSSLPSLTESKPKIELDESALPPIFPRLPPPRLLTSSSGECSEPGEHVYVNIDNMYKPYEFPPTTNNGEKALVDLCLISDPNPNRSRLNAILLSTGEYGAYFVRCSRKGDQKVLSFLSKARKVNEYKIFEEDGQLTLDQKTKTPSFDTLESMLEFYTRKGYVIETDEHLGRGIHEVVEVENTKPSNESNTLLQTL